MLVLFLSVIGLKGMAQPLLVENFDYTIGTLLTDNGWTAHSGAGTQPIDVTTGLIYSGYAGSGVGGAALLDNTGEDDSKLITPVTSGTLYCAFLTNVTTGTAGYYFNLGANATAFAARVFVKPSTTVGKINFGLSNSSTAAYATVPTDFDPGTSYLLIIKYNVATTGEASLWVLPSGVPATEVAAGTPELSISGGGQASIDRVCLRQYSSSQSMVVDAIRLATTWADAVAPSGGLTPPTLNADITSNNVDNNIDITFTDNPTWRAAVTDVVIDGTPLTALDYTLTAGNLRLLPSVGNPLLTTAGSKNVSVAATGYNYSTVVQQINAGAISAGNSTAVINPDLALNSTSTVTCTALDTYNNPISGYTFRADIQIFNLNTALTEVYIVDGVNYSSTPAPVNLTTATNASGVATFTITIPPVVNLNDGIDVQVQTSTGTNVGTDFFYTPTAPVVQITGIDPGTNPVQTSSLNNVLYRSAIQVINDAVTLTSVTTATGGTYLASDIAASGFKLWISTDATFSITDTPIASASSTSTGSGESLAFTGFSQVFGVGTNYLFVTADITSGAVPGRTVSASQNSDGNFTFNAGATITGSSYTPGNLHSIMLAPVVTELVIPKYIGSKTAASSNNARTPIAMCVQIDNLLPSTAYDLKFGLGLTSDAATLYGAGNIWNGTTFGTSNLLNAFTTNASGSSGPVWIFVQPTGNSSRFDAGQIHDLRLGFVEAGGAMPSAPNFVGTKTITALDIAVTPRTPELTDDGAFIKGVSGAAVSGKYTLVYDNVAGTGDPLFSYQARIANPTNTTQSELPLAINDVYTQSGTSVVGDFPAIVPIGANNPNGVRRIEFRNADNTIFNFNTNATGDWGVDANTTAIIRREVMTINATNSPLISVDPSSLNNFQTLPGTPSASQSFTVSGDFLTAGVTVTSSTTNFEISTNDVSFSPSVTLPASGGNLVGEPVMVYVRISATASIGAVSGTLTCTSTGATAVNVSLDGTVIAPEPTNHATGFAATAPDYSSITLTWLDNDGAQPADGFLILANTSGTFTDPVDGTPETNDPNLADGSGVMNVAHGVQTYTWAGLDPATPYYFTIYPFTNSGTAINYKTTPAAPTATATTQSYVLPLASWTFDATEPAPNTPTSIAANFGTQLTATFYADGTNGSSLWLSSASNPELTAFSGTTTNDPRIASPIAGNAIALANSSANGKTVVFKFSMTGYQDPIFSFATRGTSTGFNLHQWAWSTDNVTYTDFGTNTVNNTSSWLVRSLDMSGIDQLDQAANVYLRLTVTGSTGTTGNNRLDNIILNATPATPTTKTLNMTVLLEGLYLSAGTMRKAQGDVGDQYPGTVADQVRIELHDGSNYSNMVHFVDNVNLNQNGTLSTSIPSTFSGNYYLTVVHRNSIVTTTASPVSFAGSVITYLFDAQSKAYGDNLLSMGDGYFVLYAGDVNLDGYVDTGDVTLIDNDQFDFASGYLQTDANGDGFVDTGDITIIDNNQFNFVGAILP